MNLSSRNLTPEQSARLRQALIAAFQIDELDQIYRPLFGFSLNQHGIRTDVLPNTVMDLFHRMDTTGNWEDFSSALVTAKPRSEFARTFAELRPLMAGQEDGPPAVEKPLLDIFLSNRIPFVDRSEVRSAIGEMGTSTGWRGLIVNGPQTVGKTYCSLLLNHVRNRSWPGDRLSHVVLVEEPRSDIAPVTLAKRLAIDLKLPTGRSEFPFPAEQQGQSLDAWALDLGGWIASMIDEAGVRAWIVLDGFDHPAVPSATHLLIRRLARQAVSVPKLRLVLLGYVLTQSLPGDVDLLFTRVDLGYLTSEHLQEMFDELETRWKYRGNPKCTLLKEAVTQFISRYRDLDQGAPGHHEVLRAGLAKLILALHQAAVAKGIV
jgi:hypothetical protein